MGKAQTIEMSVIIIQRLAIAIGVAITASQIPGQTGLEFKPSWLVLEDSIDSSGNRIEQKQVPRLTNEDLYISVPLDHFYDLLKQKFVNY